MQLRSVYSVGVWLVLVVAGSAADWNQWRGSSRNGVAESSPQLLTALPPEGLKPAWISEAIVSANQGGWGSPVVAEGKVYLFAHTRSQQSADAPPPAAKYPWLPPEKRGHLTPAQYEEYEVKRREEDEARARFFNFREIVYCFDAATGKTLWKNEQPSVYTRFLHSGTPAVIDGKLYVLTPGRYARSIDARTGQDLWKQHLPGEFRDEYTMSSFAVVDGVAVVLCGHLMGLDAASGQILWQGDEKTTRGSHSSPVVWREGGKNLMLVNCGSGETLCIEPATGRELWRVKSQSNQSTPVVVENRLITFGSSRADGLRCFEISLAGAKPLWAYRQVADKGSSPVVIGKHVYVQGERRLACVELESGKAAWTTSLDLANPQYTSLVAADNKVIYASDGILWFAAQPDEFKPLVVAKIDSTGLMASEADFRRRLGLDALEKTAEGQEKSLRLYEDKIGKHGPLGCSTPAIADGRLYVRLKQGLACYDLTAPKALSQR